MHVWHYALCMLVFWTCPLVWCPYSLHGSSPQSLSARASAFITTRWPLSMKRRLHAEDVESIDWDEAEALGLAFQHERSNARVPCRRQCTLTHARQVIVKTSHKKPAAAKQSAARVRPPQTPTSCGVSGLDRSKAILNWQRPRGWLASLSLPVAKMARTERLDQTKPVLKVGADFAGIHTAGVALWLLGVNVETSFLADHCALCRNMLQQHFSPTAIHGDVLERDVSALPTDLDVYITTPPCQSFSPLGRKLGGSDPRGQLWQASLQVVRHCKPKVVIWENVASLVSAPRFRDVWNGIVAGLEDLGYHLLNKDSSVMQCLQHGLPQSRKRVILVAVRTLVHRWQGPRALSHCPAVELLVQSRPGDQPGNTHSLHGKRAKAIVKEHLALRRSQVDPKKQAVIIDCGASRGWASSAVQKAPCLSATRTATKEGFYCSTSGRCLEIGDLQRLCGFPHKFYNYKSCGVSRRQFGHMVGNAVPVNMFMRIFPAALYSGGLIRQEHARADFWERAVKVCLEAGMAVPVG